MGVGAPVVFFLRGRMKPRCAVCGRTENVSEMRTCGGERVGNFCAGKCQGLGWQAWFTMKVGGNEHEHALCLWEQKQRRAEVAGLPFLEPIPKTDAEVALDRWATSLGVP
jgi:hypothetical protein